MFEVLVNDEWVEQKPAHMDRFREKDSEGRVVLISFWNDAGVRLESTERQWRDSELLRTDALAILPDYPRGREKQVLLTYRQQLADYPQQADFPNGARPILG